MISLIIPTYKPQAYLWKCLDSIILQTFSKEHFEVIIVLNGCSNPWKSQIKNFISHKMNAMNVHFIQTPHAGVSAARNLALDVAKGDYIAFIDDDDFISPHYLELLYQRASKNTIPLSYPLSFIDGTQTYEPYSITRNYEAIQTFKDPFNYNIAKRFFGGPVYKLIHKDIIGNRRFDIRFKNSEDSLFMFLISDRFQYVTLAPK